MRKHLLFFFLLLIALSSAATAQPAADVLDGAFWKQQGLERILPPWTARAADAEHGAYFAELSRDWTPNRDGQKYPGMIGRHVFSYAAAYLMSGEEEHLERAAEAMGFMLSHGWDERHGGWYNAVSREGAVTDASKDVFMQVYAATGLALYYAATHSERALRYLERTNALLEEHAWDPERGGYVRSLHCDLSVKETFKDFSPQLAPLSGYLIFMHQATGEAAYLRQAERIMETVLQHMQDETGWVLERFDRDWQFLPEDRRNDWVNVGHNVEVAWVLLRLHLATGDENYRRRAFALNRQLTEHAFHEESGAWAHRLKATQPSEQEATTPWWVQAYGNMLQLYLYHVAEDESARSEALDRFRKGARFWNKHFVDARHEGTVLLASLDGRMTNGAKGVRTKTSYHAMEHSLLNYLLTTLWVEGETATLHFQIDDPALGAQLRPSLIEGETVRIQQARVNGEQVQTAGGMTLPLPENGPVRVETTLAPASPTVGARGETSPAPKVDEARFDLVVFGRGFEPGTRRVLLKSNPGLGEEWEEVGRLATEDKGEEWQAVVLRGLSQERFFGQDFRENYLALKVETEAGNEPARLSAVYAVPHASENTVSRLEQLIRSRPLQLRRRSLASHVRPRPATLRAGTPFIENIEAPVRFARPGEAEVAWLEMLFGL